MTLVIGPDDGTWLPGEFEVRIAVRGEDTGGVMAVLEETLPPRRLVPQHVHANDVWVQVVSGSIGVLVGDDVAEASAGAWALKPRHVPHAMWNPTDEPARLIEVLTPAGSERWFEALAKGEDDFDELCRRHGIEFLDPAPSNDRLRERFGLR
jgi:quercetin dioxygenase-like cupin family protein